MVPRTAGRLPEPGGRHAEPQPEASRAPGQTRGAPAAASRAPGQTCGAPAGGWARTAGHLPSAFPALGHL